MFRSLQQSERKLEAAQRLARVGWWERDFRTGRVSLSDEVVRTFGIDPVDLPHWHERWVNIIHPEDRKKTATAAAAALNGGPPYDVEYRVVRPDGAMRVVHSQGEVIRDESDRPVRQFGMLQDITALRHAEQELRASEERFRTLVQFSFDVYWETDAQHRFTRQEFTEGSPTRRPQGRRSARHAGKYRIWSRTRRLGASIARRSTRTSRSAISRSRGLIPTVASAMCPLRDYRCSTKRGRFTGYRGVGRHITERKRAEQELQRTHMQLVHMSRVMTTGGARNVRSRTRSTSRWARFWRASGRACAG
jgi:PAS domain S-box-containing protein